MRSLALRDISLDIGKGETVALVGESGSGKSTLARAVAGLIAPAEGSINCPARRSRASSRTATPEERRLIQFVFQNPDASLNPRARVAKALSRPLEFFFGKIVAGRRHGGAGRRQARRQICRALSGRAVGRRAPARRHRARP